MKKNEIVTRLVKDINNNRISVEAIAYDNYEKAMQNNIFANADRIYRNAVLALSKAEFLHKDVDIAQKTLSDATIARNSALITVGFSPEMLTPQYSCSSCKDTGYIDGKLCSCIQKKYFEELKSNLSPIMNFKFTDCDLTKIDDTKQRQSIATLYKKMSDFCEKFPNTKFQNIVLTGPTGSGKTCVLSAIGNELMKKGFSVQFMSAFEFNNTMLKYHTTPLDERGIYMDKVLEPDFLILDDLGTETVLKNVTCEYLLNLICSRIENNKHTAISTNLDATEICDRYGERFYSRLFNLRYTLYKALIGKDLRRK